MRRAIVAAALVVSATEARANPVPPGALQFAGGAISGTGVDAGRLGFGYVIGAQASWQPMSTEQAVGWAFRWSTLFGKTYDSSAAVIDNRLRTVMMDFTAGIRFRPWETPRRYLTLRGGVGLLRSNETIAPANVRDFLGPIASVGVDQYVLGSFLVSVDVRYGLISNGPGAIGLVIAAGFDGP